MSFIRVLWAQRGGHIHCRVFVSKTEDGPGHASGNLVFDVDEWPWVARRLAYVAGMVVVHEGDNT